MSTEVVGLTNYVDPDQLKADLEIDNADINEAMRRHAGLFAHYATLAVRARAQRDRWQTSLEILESELDRKYRAELQPDLEADPKAKKVTEPQIAAAIKGDSRWKACNSRVIAATQILKFAEVGERSFEQRKDMLLQIARNMAKEAEGQLRLVMGQQAQERQAGLREGVAKGLATLKEAAAS